ncbi:MAG: ABC transporter permease [Bacteroidales bacterium]|nr:ABC transporter permease [Bacteroidales bacterium]MCF8333172.1 ABC transporter permease [Bacteroidales bacterium]
MSRYTGNAFSNVIKREINRIRSSWIYIFSLLILPLLSFFIITAIFSQGVPRNLPIAVVDQDHSKLSRQVGRAVDATPIAEVIREPISKKAAYKAMQQGDIEAFLHIPSGTEKKSMRNESPGIALYVDNTNIVTGGLLQSGISQAVSTLSANIELQKLMKQGIQEKEAKVRAIPVNIKKHILFNPYGSYSYFLLTGLLPLMGVVFIFLTTTYAFGAELRDGTGAELLEKARGSVRMAVTAKMLPYTIVYMMNMLIINYILFQYVDIPLRGNHAMIIIGELFMIAAYQMMALFLVSLTSNLRLSLSLGSAYTMMALTFAGLTFPFSGMPLIAKMFSFIFPFRFWLEGFLSQTLRGEEIIYAIPPIYSMMVFIVIGLLSLPFLKRRLAREQFYGRM